MCVVFVMFAPTAFTNTAVLTSPVTSTLLSNTCGNVYILSNNSLSCHLRSIGKYPVSHRLTAAILTDLIGCSCSFPVFWTSTYPSENNYTCRDFIEFRGTHLTFCRCDVFWWDGSLCFLWRTRWTAMRCYVASIVIITFPFSLHRQPIMHSNYTHH